MTTGQMVVVGMFAFPSSASMCWNRRFAQPWIPERIQQSFEAITTARGLGWLKYMIAVQTIRSSLTSAHARLSAPPIMFSSLDLFLEQETTPTFSSAVSAQVSVALVFPIRWPIPRSNCVIAMVLSWLRMITARIVLLGHLSLLVSVLRQILSNLASMLHCHPPPT